MSLRCHQNGERPSEHRLEEVHRMRNMCSDVPERRACARAQEFEGLCQVLLTPAGKSGCSFLYEGVHQVQALREELSNGGDKVCGRQNLHRFDRLHRLWKVRGSLPQKGHRLGITPSGAPSRSCRLGFREHPRTIRRRPNFPVAAYPFPVRARKPRCSGRPPACLLGPPR